jgi:TPP-dependent pyruvate/acetoin dehydrogenase alpha subunit
MEAIDAETHLALYRMGRLIRRTEEALVKEYAQQEMRCPMHFCIGQEGAPAALSPLLRREDYVMSHYRSHGYYLAKRAPLAAMVSEFYGKASGANGGTAGSMELAHDDLRFFSGAIVGGPLAIAMGIAFALKYRGSNAIAVAVIGDGSLDEGISYESLNLAALHGVPLLAICENNLYAAHTPEAKRTLSRSLLERVRPFGLRSERLDGMDIVKLYADLRPIVDELRSRASSGPWFIEIETYRYCGHVGPENDDWLDYRSAEEIAAWRQRDPVALARLQAEKAGVSGALLVEVEQAIEQEIAAAFEAAKRADFPSYDWSLAQVSSESYAPIVTQFIGSGATAFDSRQAETRLKPY